METQWILLVVAFGLWLTKAGDLGAPYRLATIFFILLETFYAGMTWITFVPIFCVIDYLCAKFYMKRTDEFSNILKWLLLYGVVTHFFLGVEIAFETNFVYDNWEIIIQGLNILQIFTLMIGGYSAGLVDRRWFMDKYSRGMASKELMVALARSCYSRLFVKFEGKA